MHDAEWQTRRQRIDTRLRSLSPPGEIVPRQTGLTPAQLTRHAVTEFPTANGPADYALFVNGQPLGILEAKKVTVNPQNVLEQAKRYARGAVNFSIEEEDFDLTPLPGMRGGRAKAGTVFGDLSG